MKKYLSLKFNLDMDVQYEYKHDMLEDVWSVGIKADDDRIEFKKRNVWYTQILQIADSVLDRAYYITKIKLWQNISNS